MSYAIICNLPPAVPGPPTAAYTGRPIPARSTRYNSWTSNEPDKIKEFENITSAFRALGRLPYLDYCVVNYDEAYKIIGDQGQHW